MRPIHSASTAVGSGAHIRDRTGDLSLTKTVLYLLSYVGKHHRHGADMNIFTNPEPCETAPKS